MYRNSDIFISLVVPAYNASSYLDRFFNSVDSQNSSAFEVVIVDDGSTDDTYDLLCKKSKCCSSYRVIVIHQNNSGQNAARFRGLQEASGEYVWFVDIDDMIVSDAISNLKEMLRHNTSSECVIFEKMRIAGNRCTPVPDEPLFASSRIFDSKSKRELISILIEGSKLNSLWSKVFLRKKLLEVVRGINDKPSLRYGEDFILSSFFLDNAKTIMYDPAPLYVYFDVSSSVMHDRLSEKWISDSEEIFRVKKEIASHYAEDLSKELLEFSGVESCGYIRKALKNRNKIFYIKRIISSNFFRYAKTNCYKGDTVKKRLAFSALCMFSIFWGNA